MMPGSALIAAPKSRNWQRIGFALLPLLGVLLLGWDARSIVTYYWAANAAILFTQPVFSLLGYQRRNDPAHWAPPATESIPVSGPSPGPFAPTGRGRGATTSIGSSVGFVFLTVFFCFHFGVFTFVHLLFLKGFNMVNMSMLKAAVIVQAVRRVVLDRETEIAKNAANPFPMYLYANVAVLHLTIIFGAFISFFLGIRTSMVGGLLICGAGAAFELRGGKLRRKPAPGPETTPDGGPLDLP